MGGYIVSVVQLVERGTPEDRAPRAVFRNASVPSNQTWFKQGFSCGDAIDADGNLGLPFRCGRECSFHWPSEKPLDAVPKGTPDIALVQPREWESEGWLRAASRRGLPGGTTAAQGSLQAADFPLHPEVPAKCAVAALWPQDPRLLVMEQRRPLVRAQDSSMVHTAAASQPDVMDEAKALDDLLSETLSNDPEELRVVYQRILNFPPVADLLGDPSLDRLRTTLVSATDADVAKVMKLWSGVACANSTLVDFSEVLTLCTGSNTAPYFLGCGQGTLVTLWYLVKYFSKDSVKLSTSYSVIFDAYVHNKTYVSTVEGEEDQPKRSALRLLQRSVNKLDTELAITQATMLLLGYKADDSSETFVRVSPWTAAVYAEEILRDQAMRYDASLSERSMQDVRSSQLDVGDGSTNEDHRSIAAEAEDDSSSEDDDGFISQDGSEAEAEAAMTAREVATEAKRKAKAKAARGGFVEATGDYAFANDRYWAQLAICDPCEGADEESEEDVLMTDVVRPANRFVDDYASASDGESEDDVLIPDVAPPDIDPMASQAAVERMDSDPPSGNATSFSVDSSDPLQQLLARRQARLLADEETRKRVGDAMAIRMATGVRVNPSLVHAFGSNIDNAGPNSLPHCQSNASVAAESMHSTSVNQGLRADSVAQADYDMAGMNGAAVRNRAMVDIQARALSLVSGLSDESTRSTAPSAFAAQADELETIANRYMHCQDVLSDVLRKRAEALRRCGDVTGPEGRQSTNEADAVGLFWREFYLDGRFTVSHALLGETFGASIVATQHVPLSNPSKGRLLPLGGVVVSSSMFAADPDSRVELPKHEVIRALSFKPKPVLPIVSSQHLRMCFWLSYFCFSLRRSAHPM